MVSLYAISCDQVHKEVRTILLLCGTEICCAKQRSATTVLAWVDVQLSIKTRKIILEHDDARSWVFLFAELDALDDFLDSWQVYLVLLTSVVLSRYPVVDAVQFSITTL